jgi:hypothetical protein
MRIIVARDFIELLNRKIKTAFTWKINKDETVIYINNPLSSIARKRNVEIPQIPNNLDFKNEDFNLLTSLGMQDGDILPTGEKFN